MNEKWIKIGGWVLSFLIILAGVSFIWPNIHTSLLGIVLFYLGIRVFYFSTFKEYSEKRIKLIDSLRKW